MQDLKQPVNIQLLDDIVMIRHEPAKEQTTGGVYLPDTVTKTKKLTRGYVVAHGHGFHSDNGNYKPLTVKLGDYVIHPEYAGEKVEVEGETLTVLRERDLLGVVG